MDAVKFFEIIKKYNIIKDNSCERFELVGDDFDVNQFRVEWDNRCNPQEMMIYIGSESYIFIKIKQGVLKSDYEINKNFIAFLKDELSESERLLLYDEVIKHIKTRSILLYMLDSAMVDDEEKTGLLDVFVNIINIYEKWSSETYESRNICFCIGVDCNLDEHSNSTLDLIQTNGAL